MKAAIVKEWGKPPVYGDFGEPVASQGELLVKVTAAALSRLAKSRASGTHYSATDASLPLVPGVDGVGRLDDDDGRRVYFFLPRPPFGSFAELSVVDASLVQQIPEGLDDVTAAAIANPGVSSWAALRERAKLVRGETVLVNGATGTAGRLAVQIAKHLGASRVVATGRSADALESLKSLGADATVRLSLPDDKEEGETRRAFARQFAEGIDVVLDYLWGRSAELLLAEAARSGREGSRIRFIAIGSASGSDITLPDAVLRSSGLELMGSGLRSIPVERLLKASEGLFQAVKPAGLEIKTEAVPLADVERAWSESGKRSRIVFVTGRET
jgi:NADPH:quinone reductase-like Zn-dependent oxidoreductase